MMETSDARSLEILPSKAARLGFGLLFAFAAGWVDAIGFVSLGSFYLSFMSGNTTQLGVAVAGGEHAMIWRGASVIAAFFAGAVLGTLIADAARLFRIPSLLTVEVALFGAAIALTRSAPGFAALLPVAVAMGMQNGLRQMVGRADVGKSFVTGALFSAGQSLARAMTGGAPRGEWLVFLATWFCFAAGAAGGAFSLASSSLVANLGLVAGVFAGLAFFTFLIALDARSSEQDPGSAGL
ncbi:protein of unknown function DUF1275 [Methylocella silvestris BL2]|uniref:DUF1275 family protein n=1 Tax=Methylocella silvestris (strain DSM 15510 / CIP 108128 / LMG 27833 / NCIMB 13906 / BL2) TaxID=395965 RepID=B8EQ42_METSB|nr:YoaK family protein [Methylocella silvestris]ACK51532.1 protein of unknown function DUF1275 [Methylocella silvestris BL2]